MPQKNILLLVAVFCCLSIFSCKKDASNPNTNPGGTDSTGNTSSLVKTITWSGSDSIETHSGKYVYEFDTKQRLVREYTYIYGQSTQDTTTFTDTMNTFLHYTDSTSLQPYGYTYSSKSNNSSNTSEHIVKYNANHYPILDSVINGSSDFTNYTIISPSENYVVYKKHNGYSDYSIDYDSLFLDSRQQITKITSGWIYNNGTSSHSSSMEYTYTTIPYPGFDVNIAAIFWNSPLTLANFKFFPATSVYISDSTIRSETYQYTKDSLGRVKTLTTYTNGKITQTATWEYF